MCSTGWITHFGEKMANTSAEELTSALAALLGYANGTASVNLYMAHGGSNWGFMAGDRACDSKASSMPGIRTPARRCSVVGSPIALIE